MLDVMPYVRYSLQQRLFIYNAYVIKYSFKTCHKFRRHFPGISVPSRSRPTIQKIVKNVRETDSVVDKKIKPLGQCGRKSVH